MITLGIIGIVAALTMPALVANYQKKVVVTRLQRFDNIVNNLARMHQSNDETNLLEEAGTQAAVYNPDFAQRQLEHFFKYTEHSSIEKKVKGAVMGFPDGSGVYLVKRVYTDDCKACWVFTIFCPEYKYCKDFDDSVGFNNYFLNFVDGKKAFAYVDMVHTHGRNSNKDDLALECSTDTNRYSYCAAKIRYDGWEIAPDYPW